MSIHDFMAAYKRVWEAQDSDGFAALFTTDGQYWNTPFQVQDSPEKRALYWDRIKLQTDVALDYTVLGETPMAALPIGMSNTRSPRKSCSRSGPNPLAPACPTAPPAIRFPV